MNKPYEEILNQTREELSDYIFDIDSIGIGETIDKINEEIDLIIDGGVIV